jgi:tetratricopeptide (TPR) repeat protein
MMTQPDPLTELLQAESESDPAIDLTGRKVAFAGRLEAFNRQEATQLVRQRGGFPVSASQDAEIVVVGMRDLPLDDLDSLLNEAQTKAVAEGRLLVVSESRFWQWIGLIESDLSVRRLYTAAMLASLLGVSLATIRRWHRRGLIVPFQMVHKLAYYDFQEVAMARQLAQWIQSGASPAALESKLSRLAQLFPDIQRPLSQLSIIIEGKELLLREGEGLIEPGGQRRIDFVALEPPDADPSPAPATVSVSQLRETEDLTTPDQYRRLATELEDEGRAAEAVHVYRSMQFAFGPSAEINFAIAELLYLQGDVGAARERYFVAIELDQSFVEARASLGCLLLEQHEVDLAISTLHGALQLHPRYADAHFHLARAYDDNGQPEQAALHWRQFLELSPDNPWGDEARER